MAHDALSMRIKRYKINLLFINAIIFALRLKSRKLSDYIDEIKISISSGNGGNGSTSFRREKFVPFGGPDGGNGGNGGNVYVVGNVNLNSFRDLTQKRLFKAKNGVNGKGSNKNGKNGEDVIIPVPLGTEIFNIETKELIVDVKENKIMYLIAEGGNGGLGNSNFKTSKNQAPRKSTQGKKGKKINLFLNLKSLSDIGIVGFPNVGKSSLISLITNSKAEVGDYDFTTLSPNLGVIKTLKKDYLIADIPGIVKGASKGKGLGLKFLKHIERSGGLIIVLDSSCESYEMLIQQFNNLLDEMNTYSVSLSKRIKLIINNKFDLCKFKNQLNEKKISKSINQINFSCIVHTKKELENLKETLLP